MKYTIDHSIEASVFLWLDNLLIEKSQGFSNHSGAFRRDVQTINGFTAFAAPHRQLVYDSSISGAIVPTEVSINGAPQTLNNTGLILDYYNGQVLRANNANASVSGSYSYKEVNLYFTSKTENEVIFENRFVTIPRNTPEFTGVSAKDLVYPCIFIKCSAGENEMMSFDGAAKTTVPIRLTFLSDTPYLYKAATSAIRDRQDTFLALFDPIDLPFGQYYNLKTGAFDYSESVKAIQQDPNRLAYIRDVSVSDFQDRINKEIGPRVFGGFIDLDLEVLRFPHPMG